MHRRKAFSLVELLTVIGIIGLLIALLMPVLTKARSEAVKVKCMSNLHNLLQAQMMYVTENKGFLTYANWSQNLEATNNWSIGWLYTQGRTSDPLRQDDVKTGALFHYLNDTKVYHCPTHFVDDVPPEWTERLTSYIMNGAVCGYGTVGNHDATPEIWVPSWKITDWKNSSEQILWWEAEENSDIPGAVAWNDGSSYPYENALAKRHGRGASVGCFDGHVEWMDRIDFLTEYQKPGANRLYCDPHRADGGHSAGDARQ